MRNYNNMTADKNMERVDKNDVLQSIFSMSDPNEITTTLNRELNKIAVELITKKRVQHKKMQRNTRGLLM